MGTAHNEIIQIPATTAMKALFEENARQMNLTPEAYLGYLMSRAEPGVDVARFDRHVREVFGKNGELIRRLAK
jgi:hypothetical protein